jgi:hypothetical protein
MSQEMVKSFNLSGADTRLLPLAGTLPHLRLDMDVMPLPVGMLGMHHQRDMPGMHPQRDMGGTHPLLDMEAGHRVMIIGDRR